MWDEPDWDIYSEEDPERIAEGLREEAVNLRGRLASLYCEAVTSLRVQTGFLDLAQWAPYQARVDRLWRLLNKSADRVDRREGGSRRDG